jgi:hypothetical protein
VTQVKIRFFADEGLHRHICRSFPRPSDKRWHTMQVLSPPPMPDMLDWDKAGPFDIVDLRVTLVESRLIRMQGAEFWAWVHQDGDVWNVYF